MADQIEKDASDKSIFICSKCNHTASLTEINQRRVKFAGDEYSVKPVTINDKVSCPVSECEGVMNYVATDESEKLYVNAAEGGDPLEESEDLLETEDVDKKPVAPKPETPEAPKPEEEMKEIPPEEKTDDFNIDDLFEDVETQNQKAKADKQDAAITTQKARKERTDEKNRLEEEQDKGLGIPPDKEPLATPPVKTEPDPSAVKEEPVLEEEKPKKPKKKPTDVIKKDVPKFKSKEAADRYEAVCSRYSV